MRIGYSFWGYLGDYKYDAQGDAASTPDGNATYSWSIICAAMKAGHKVYPMQNDRDAPGFAKHGLGLFSSFSQWKRYAAYKHLRENYDSLWNSQYGLPSFPKLDVLLLEWRFPIPGRNVEVDKTSAAYQPDWDRQQELLQHYLGTKTKVIIWDLDNKLTLSDELVLSEKGDFSIFETAVQPETQFVPRIRVEPPFLMEDVLQYSSCRVNKNKKIVYIGSRYERDDVIDEWLGSGEDIHFHGKWDDDAKKCWPHITFHERCTTKDFGGIYRDAAIVPLLAKRSYMKRGFITPRPIEALLFGSLPVGLAGHLGIENYVLPDFVVNNHEELQNISRDVAKYGCSSENRQLDREELAHKLSFMDAGNFIKRIEELV